MMVDKKKLEDVFKTVGLPPYTYVKPKHFGEVRADISQAGKHLLIEGPSGIGKTCVVFKVFEELHWIEGREFNYVGCRDKNAEQVIDEFLKKAADGDAPSPRILVIDDFHLLAAGKRAEIGSSLKRLSDRAFEQAEPAKVILIGIPTTGVSLLSDAYDLGPRLGSYALNRASDTEIDKVISEGEQALSVLFEDRDVLLSESAGNFWLAQYVCNKVCAMEEVYETQDDPKILTFDILGIRGRLMAELTQRYLPIARTFAKGKKWRPGGNKPYLEILLVLCKIPDSVVTFDKLLQIVSERRRPGLKAVRARISEVIFDPNRETDLRKQIAFEADSGFSIEDPLFRYFLTNLDSKLLFRDLGIEESAIENGRLYTYDIGFSFAGEVRRLVELVNAEMKAEDLITFYDFDQQAILLATDLQNVLGKVYGESCRYYLVFLDGNYREKVWTRFEKDVMTGGKRSDHIIPVIVDDEGASGTVGISNTLGRIDLKDVWAQIKKTGKISNDDVNTIKNRCVAPMIEKIGVFP
ncbi:AAA family ATPase (plasmid) [Ralstonia sp. 25C]|uniref:AAA family ATPase n=1 Tax=Ralstonia sp. 25C TaxID=3447363 RepID=UPI003F75501C